MLGCVLEKKPALSIYQKGLQKYKRHSIDIPGLDISFVSQGFTIMTDYFIVSSYDKNQIKIKKSFILLFHRRIAFRLSVDRELLKA